MVCDKPASTAIIALQDPTGSKVRDRKGFQSLCKTFYSELYSASLDTTCSQEAMQNILVHVPHSFSIDKYNRFSAPITVAKLKLELFDMAKDKNPGPDGLAVEFYVMFWDLIGDEFSEIINLAIRVGHLPYGMTSGLLTLLHKRSPRDSPYTLEENPM
jgi:hypothetical protein